MNFNNFYFFEQSIHDLTTGKVRMYELLLRGKADSTLHFPMNTFAQCITERAIHEKYLIWLEQTLMKICKEHPKKLFCLNLDHQELEYEETFHFLLNIQRLSRQLIIEITELPPMERGTFYYNAINKKAFRKIYELGFKIALDDMGNGLNSLENFFQVQEYLSTIKFSLLHFQNRLDQRMLKELILFFADIAQTFRKDFVIEGVEDSALMTWLKGHVSGLVQGYFYSKPHLLSSLTIKNQ